MTDEKKNKKIQTQTNVEKRKCEATKMEKNKPYQHIDPGLLAFKIVRK